MDGAASHTNEAQQSVSGAKAPPPRAKTEPKRWDWPVAKPADRWPRLSETLTGPRHPDYCQACGKHRDEIAKAGGSLTIWQEAAQNAKETFEAIYVAICSLCNSDKGPTRRKVPSLVEKHPRLYHALEMHRPQPGIMSPLCVDCSWRDGMHCSHPDSKMNGGDGLMISFPKPHEVHMLCSPRAGSGWRTIFPGPATSCSGREEIDVVADIVEAEGYKSDIFAERTV